MFYISMFGEAFMVYFLWRFVRKEKELKEVEKDEQHQGIQG